MSWMLSSSLGLFAIAFATLGHAALASGSVAPCTEGRRGVARQQALVDHGWLHALDPLLRRLTRWLSPLLPDRARQSLERRLQQTGYPLGLDAREWVALNVISTTACGSLAAALGWLLGRTSIYALVGTTVGCALPWLRLQGARHRRDRDIAHGLPGAIDLAGLCMGAGLDFAASVETIVEQSHDSRGPLARELQHLLRALRLGRTRSAALEELARAVPIACVEEVVAAVRQADRKGTPLASVLAVQAEMLRRKRAVAAEEAAARAAVLLVFPLLLLMGSVLLLLFSPFIINGFGL